jgi:hypothetical protein
MLAIHEFNAVAITYMADYASRALCLRRNTGRRVTASLEAVAHSQELMVKIDALIAEINRTAGCRLHTDARRSMLLTVTRLGALRLSILS